MEKNVQRPEDNDQPKRESLIPLDDGRIQSFGSAGVRMTISELDQLWRDISDQIINEHPANQIRYNNEDE